MMRITGHKHQNLQKNSKIEGFQDYNVKARVMEKPFAEDDITALKPEKHGPEEIIQVKRLRIPRTLEAKYPGLKNFDTKVPVE